MISPILSPNACNNKDKIFNVIKKRKAAAQVEG